MVFFYYLRIIIFKFKYASNMPYFAKVNPWIITHSFAFLAVVERFIYLLFQHQFDIIQQFVIVIKTKTLLFSYFQMKIYLEATSFYSYTRTHSISMVLNIPPTTPIPTPDCSTAQLPISEKAQYTSAITSSNCNDGSSSSNRNNQHDHLIIISGRERQRTCRIIQ